MTSSEIPVGWCLGVSIWGRIVDGRGDGGLTRWDSAL